MGYHFRPVNSLLILLFLSLRRMAYFPPRSMTNIESSPNATVVRSPPLSGVIASSVIPSPAEVTVAPLCTFTTVASPWRSNSPATAGPDPSGSTMSLDGSVPKRLVPSLSQNSPATVSHPVSLFGRVSQPWRHSSIPPLSAPAAVLHPSCPTTQHPRPPTLHL